MCISTYICYVYTWYTRCLANGEDHYIPYYDDSPVWGANYLELECIVPKTRLQS